MLYKRCECPTKCRHFFWYEFALKGRRYRRSTRTANRQTAERIEQRRRDRILDPYAKDEDDAQAITLSKHIEDYCAHTEKKNATAYKDSAVLDRVATSVGSTALAAVSPFHIERWKTWRATEVSKSTVNRELNIVRGCFSRAVEWNRIEKSPCDAVKLYKVDDARIRVLSDDEIREVLHADPIVALICRVTLECLPRLSEVLHIDRTHIGASWVEIRRKGGYVDRITISDDLRERLLSTPMPALTQQAASVRIARELRRLKILGASHHTMRHTGVTLMLERGENPRAIQRLAGWSSLRMLERYGHARDAALRQAVTGNAAYLATIEATTEAKDGTR